MEDIKNESKAPQNNAVSGVVKRMDVSTYLNMMLLKYALYITSPKFLLMSGFAVSVGIITEGFLCFTLCQGLFVLINLWLIKFLLTHEHLLSKKINPKLYTKNISLYSKYQSLYFKFLLYCIWSNFNGN